MNDQNPMSSNNPWNLVAEGYVTDTMPLFKQYCEKAIELSGMGEQEKILDVACGPGTLSLLIQEKSREIHAIDFSDSMLDCFNREITRLGIEHIQTHLMDGQNLQFEDASFDRAFSIFGLMFFPDRLRGFREMHRVLRPGGRAAVTSWAPVSESSGMTLMFGAIQHAFPKKPQSSDEKILTLENPDQFKHEMETAGFEDVTITPVNGYWPVESTEEFLDSMTRGSAPITMLKNSLPEEQWAGKRAMMIDYLEANMPALPASLNSLAYIGVGTK